MVRATVEGPDSAEALLSFVACEGGGPGGGSNA